MFRLIRVCEFSEKINLSVPSKSFVFIAFPRKQTLRVGDIHCACLGLEGESGTVFVCDCQTGIVLVWDWDCEPVLNHTVRVNFLAVRKRGHHDIQLCF